MSEAFLVRQDDPDFRVAINGGITLGRTKDNEIVLADKLASRRHASVAFENGAYLVRDLDSTNGTFVNDTAMKAAELVAGDTIRIGSSCFRFEVEGAVLNGATNGVHVEPVEAIVVEDEADVAPAVDYGELHEALESLRVFPKYLRLEGHAEIYSAGSALVDVYDVWPVNDTTIGLFLGTFEPRELQEGTDLAVLAKAALLGALRASAQRDAQPAEVLNRLSAACKSLPEITGPVNAVYAEVDRRTGVLAVAVAGNPAPVLFNRLSVEPLESPIGPALGAGGGDYSGVEHVLEQGDGLLLYSNGVVDARRDAEATPIDQANTYGLAAVRGLVKGRNGDSPATIVRALLDDVVAFCKPSTPQDDCAALAVRYRGKTG